MRIPQSPKEELVRLKVEHKGDYTENSNVALILNVSFSRSKTNAKAIQAF
jgi:hypothetical protein